MFPINRTISLVVFATIYLITSVLAQTTAQNTACSQTIAMIDYDEFPIYDTSDTNAYAASFSYDVTACTSHGNAPVKTIYLWAESGGPVITCHAPATLDSSGVLSTTCSTTYGYLAERAVEGDADWVISILIGTRSSSGPGFGFEITPTSSSSPPSKRDLSRRAWWKFI